MHIDLLSFVKDRLQNKSILPDFCAKLEEMAKYDQDRLPQYIYWGNLHILKKAFDYSDIDTTPFEVAWIIMFESIVRLDHIQDKDPEYDPILSNEESNALQYQLSFGYYLLATSILDLLSDTVSPERLCSLKKLWNTAMLEMAGGQYQDIKYQNTSFIHPTVYQSITESKTGATFALGFAGIAILLSNDDALVQRLWEVGRLYGTLLQYADDILDKDNQLRSGSTLPNILQQVYANQQIDETHLKNIWKTIYRSHIDHLNQMIYDMPTKFQQAITQIFTRTFLA